MNKSLKKLRQRTKFFGYLLYGSIGISVLAFIIQVLLQMNGAAGTDRAMAFWVSVAGFFSSLWAYAGGIWLTSSLFLWSTEAIIDSIDNRKWDAIPNALHTQKHGKEIK